MKIDLNCDLGESFGNYRIGEDEAIMPLITSANIACGLHAGDPAVMDKTVKLAQTYEVNVGAHPGYPDLQGFGRRNMDLGPEEIEQYILYQLGALAAFAKAHHVEMVHVKPHGALYNQAAANHSIASAIAKAVAWFSSQLILVGLAGSLLIEAGIEAGLRTGNEAFPDRAYNPDGSLRSRRLPGAVLDDPVEVANHALTLVRNGIIISAGSQTKTIPVDTLCLHGDHLLAVQNANALRSALESNGIMVARMI